MWINIVLVITITGVNIDVVEHDNATKHTRCVAPLHYNKTRKSLNSRSVCMYYFFLFGIVILLINKKKLYINLNKADCFNVTNGLGEKLCLWKSGFTWLLIGSGLKLLCWCGGLQREKCIRKHSNVNTTDSSNRLVSVSSRLAA